MEEFLEESLGEFLEESLGIQKGISVKVPKEFLGGNSFP